MARLGKKERATLVRSQEGRKPRNFSNKEVSIRSCLANMIPSDRPSGKSRSSKTWGHSYARYSTGKLGTGSVGSK